MAVEKDYLTGLYTRQGLYEWYDTLKKDVPLQFMFLDLDNFKSVNDVYGHSVGDELLKSVANIFIKCAPQALTARLGGDEFVLIFKDNQTRESISDIAGLIIKTIEKKEGFDVIGTNVSASIGILLDASSSTPLNDIMFKIDTAMYKAKDQGKGRYVIFNDISELILDEIRMEQNQEAALMRNEFKIYYQPIVSAQTSRLFMTDAVVMWDTPDGLRHQRDFLHVFERNGFIKTLNVWAFENICATLKEHHEQTQTRLRVHVRLSSIMLSDGNFPELVTSIMQAYGVEPGEICFGVSETAFSRGVENVLPTLKLLADLGISIIVTHVGVDFACIRYLDKLPLSAIRLNAGYIAEAMKTAKGKLILRTIFAMGHDLNLQVIADGVKDKEIVGSLVAWGCNSVCGPYYGSEMPLDQYETEIKKFLAYGERRIEFAFRNSFQSMDRKYTGVPSTENISLVPGICARFGAARFPGGDILTEVVELPAEVMAYESYTVSFWLKPEDQISWTSVIYSRYLGGFATFSPHIIGGGAGFRISEDADAMNGFHDAFGRSLPLNKWSFICFSYDSRSGFAHLYMNGRKVSYIMDVPMLSGCRQVLLGGDPFQPCYKGSISALTFFDSAKSDDEVKELYNRYFEEKGFAGEREDFWMDETVSNDNK